MQDQYPSPLGLPPGQRDSYHGLPQQTDVQRDIGRPGDVASYPASLQLDAAPGGVDLRRANFLHSESLDCNSEITQLCHTLSKLTGGGGNAEHTHILRDEKKSIDRAPYLTTPFASVSVLANSIDPDSCTRVSRHTLGSFGNSTLVTMVNDKQNKQGGRYLVEPIPEGQVQTSRRKHHSAGEEGLESQTLKFLNKMKHNKPGSRHRHRTKTTSGEPVKGAEPRPVLSPRTLRRNQQAQTGQT